jgi:hypothetical protein
MAGAYMFPKESLSSGGEQRTVWDEPGGTVVASGAAQIPTFDYPTEWTIEKATKYSE